MNLARTYILVCAIAWAASPALAANWTEKPIVSAGFGTGPDQFGYAGIEASKKTTRLVNCFAADRSHIAVHDRIKKDVKLYSAAGVFQPNHLKFCRWVFRTCASFQFWPKTTIPASSPFNWGMGASPRVLNRFSIQLRRSKRR